MKYRLAIIYLESRGQSIRSCLENSFSWIKERGPIITFDETIREPYCCLQISLQGRLNDRVFKEEEIIDIFKHQMAEILAEGIVAGWEECLIKRCVERHHKHLGTSGQLELAMRARGLLKNYSGKDGTNLLLKFGRKSKIFNDIMKCLQETAELNLEGLVNFRLTDYRREVRLAVEFAHEDMQNERKYNDFVKLLKYYVENQPPRVLEANVFYGAGETLQLWDEKGQEIDQTIFDAYVEDIIGLDSNFDDILVSILITMAPRRIVFHSSSPLPDSESIRIIKRVFKEKIVVCQGCPRCLAIQLGE